MRRLRRLLAAGALLALAACSTTPPPLERPSVVRPAPAPPPPARLQSAASWAELAGWPQEDHLAALTAVRTVCRLRPQRYPGACRALTSERPASDFDARRYVERWFRLEAEPAEGLLTAYYTPIYPARRAAGEPFTAPVRAPPADPILAAEDRAAIDAAPPESALGWMKPEDLFFLQVQGSGVLEFEDGARVKAVYAASNGKPFVPVGRVMREQGILDDRRTSAQAISDWLAAHRGPEAEGLMAQNPRYVFFKLLPDDASTPEGAAGVALPPGRAVASDPTFNPMGELLWIDASDPRLSGARSSYRRLVAALDVGSAIKGPARADLYAGRGSAAGQEAGLVRHRLRLYRLASR